MSAKKIAKKAPKKRKFSSKKTKNAKNKSEIRKISCCSWNKHTIALVLSIIPGLGQIYKKDWIDFFAVYFGFLVALWCFGVKNILPEEMFWYSFLSVLGWIILIGTYIWNLIDAYRS